jgi:hypothetical protein
MHDEHFDLSQFVLHVSGPGQLAVEVKVFGSELFLPVYVFSYWPGIACHGTVSFRQCPLTVCGVIHSRGIHTLLQ